MRKSRLATAVTAVMCLSFAFAARADVLDTSLFAKKITFTVSGYNGETTLPNFPVLVRLSANSPDGFSYNDCAADGSDIRFADEEGNLIPHEIDTWDTNGTSLVWVSVPSLFGTASGKTTEFRAYYAPDLSSSLPAVSSNAVWNAAGYYGVWHMNEANATDSSANHLDGTADASITVVDAKLGKGADFPSSAGSSTGITTTNTPNAAFASGISFETWAYPYNVTEERAFFGKEALATFKVNAGLTRFTTPGKTDFDVKQSISANTWQHLVVTFVPKGAVRVYVNGQLKKTQNDNGSKQGFNDLTKSCPVILGGNQWSDKGQYYKGILDECRLVTTELSADWIAADYATQNDSTFLTASSVVDSRSVGISLTFNGGTSASFSSLVDGFSLSGGQTATLKILYGTAEDALNSEFVVSDAVSASGLFPAQIKGLTRGTAYYFKSVLVLANSTTIESAVLPVTTLADFTTAMRRIEYIEGNGSQYIDSGYYPTPNTHVKADYQFTAVQNQNRVFGMTVVLYFSAYINGGGNFGYCRANDNNSWKSVGSGTKVGTLRYLHDFNYINGDNQHAYTIYGPDGSVTATQAPMEGTATQNAAATLTLAAQRTDAEGTIDEGTLATNHRIYSMLFDEGDTNALTAALAPAVRTSDGAVGLYDSVSGRFLPSASAASYVAGPTIKTVERYTGTALTSVDLTFLGAPMARTLKIAYGSGFGGDNPANWDATETVATIAAGATSYSVTSIPANWGTDNVCVLRCYFDDGTTFPLWSDAVIYQDTSKPIVSSVTVDGTGGDSLIVRGNIPYFPGNDCSLSVRVTKGTDEPVVWSNLTNLTATGDFELTLLESDPTAARYIEPGATYSVVVEATSGGATGRSSAVAVTTEGAPVFVSSGSSVNQRNVTFTGNLGDLGANTNAVVTLYVGTQNNANKLEAVETPVTRTAAGSFSIAHTFADYERTYYWQLRAVATTAGGNAITTRTDIASCKTVDAATYTWRAVDGDWNGDWNDSRHWSASSGDCIGYPDSSHATASFANCSTNNPVVVNVNGKYQVAYLRYYGMTVASDVTFAGNGTVASQLTAGGVAHNANNNKTNLKAGTKVVYKDLTLVRDGDWDLVRDVNTSNLTYRFERVTTTGNNRFCVAVPASRIEFVDSNVTCNNTINIGGGGTVLLIDNSTITKTAGNFHLQADVAEAGRGPMEVVFRGAAPKIVSPNFFMWNHANDDGGVKVTFEVPKDGYAEAPLQITTAKFGADGSADTVAKFEFAVDPMSPAIRQAARKVRDMVVVSTAAGFNTDLIADGIGTVETRRGVVCGEFKYGVDGAPLAEGAAPTTARQILCDYNGQLSRTIFIVH